MAMLIIFLLVPLIEIYVLIEVGSVVGAGWTVLLVITTAVLGVALLRVQGINTLQRAQKTLAHGLLPALAMMEGVALLLSGALLLTPGFVTDTAGFMLLLPSLRQRIVKHIMRHKRFAHYSRTHDAADEYTETVIIEGQFSRHDDHLPQ